MYSMKKIISLLLLFMFFAPVAAFAVEFDVNELRPVISGDDVVRVNKNIIFDASASFLPDPELYG
jgi:hypothetical protein